MAWNGMRLGPSHDEHSNSIVLNQVVGSSSNCQLREMA
jgi:hypothetical protein